METMIDLYDPHGRRPRVGWGGDGVKTPKNIEKCTEINRKFPKYRFYDQLICLKTMNYKKIRKSGTTKKVK